MDAARDLRDAGALRYEEVKIHDLKRLKAKPTQKLLSSFPTMSTGVLFSTYDLLISGASTGTGKKAAGKKGQQAAAKAARPVSKSTTTMTDEEEFGRLAVADDGDEDQDEFGEHGLARISVIFTHPNLKYTYYCRGGHEAAADN